MRKAMLLLLPLIVLACDQAPTAPAADARPEYDFMNNPDVGNLRVTRFAGHMAVCWTDPATGYRACHSTIPLGGGTEPDCGPQEVFDPIGRQEIGLIDFDDLVSSWLRVNQKGEAWITVRDLATPGTCFNNRLVAEGWGRLSYHDNDLFGTLPEDNNANAWGFFAHGRLERPEGGVGVYQGRQQFSYNQQQLLHVIASTAVVH